MYRVYANACIDSKNPRVWALPLAHQIMTILQIIIFSFDLGYLKSEGQKGKYFLFLFYNLSQNTSLKALHTDPTKFWQP